MKRFWLLVISSLLIVSCKPQDIPEAETTDEYSSETTGPMSCNLQALGIDTNLGSPAAIDELVELINALPRPLNLPCFLSALNRPLKVNLTNSTRSAQPANGDDNPRIFIMNYPLIMSITVDGGGSFFLEMSEYTTESRSIKGELKFPIYEEIIDVSKPLQKIDRGFASACIGCHNQEEKTNNTNYPLEVFESVAIKPEGSQKVEIEDFKGQLYQCEYMANTSYRCGLIIALFNHGPLVWENFPAGTPTFFQTF